MESWVIIHPQIDPLQSLHSQVEQTGNKLPVEIYLLQQLKLMEHYGLGEVVNLGI